MELTFHISEQNLRRIGVIAIQAIQKRTEAGIDADGKAFRPYSTRWFFRPLGGLTKASVKKLGRLAGRGEARFLHRGGSALWVLVHGYATYKRELFPQEFTGHPNLRQSGAMIDALTVVAVSGSTVRIGFSGPDEAERAYYQEERGRRFLGLTEEERAEIAARALEFIEIK